MSVWKLTWRKARTVEWNNLMKKARSAYLPYVTELFTRADLPFKLHTEWCNYLYLNGVIDHVAGVNKKGRKLISAVFHPLLCRKVFTMHSPMI